LRDDVFAFYPHEDDACLPQEHQRASVWSRMLTELPPTDVAGRRLLSEQKPSFQQYAATLPRQTKRYDHLDGLRGLAALNVVLSHAIAACDFAVHTGAAEQSHGGWELALAPWPLLPVAGNFSVCVFFVLSGFVLAHAFSRPQLGMTALAVKRFVRLGLPILTAILFSWAVLACGLMFNHAAAPLTRSIWLNGQFQQHANFWAALREGSYGSLITVQPFDTTYNAALWTMPIEFAGSIFLIVLFGIFNRLCIANSLWRKPVVGTVLIGTGIALQPLYVSLVMFGAAMSVLEPQRLTAGWTPPSWLIAGLIAISLILGTTPYSAARGPWWDILLAHAPLIPVSGHLTQLGSGFAAMDNTAIWHGIGAILLVLTIEWCAVLQRLLSRPLTQRLGLISFPLYLIHLPILMSVGCGALLIAHDEGFTYRAAAAFDTAVFLAVAMLLASASVRWVERPSMRLAAGAGVVTQKSIDQAIVAARHVAFRKSV
jgi:peptidoglycan/LPS O-acetylase OafA/YrhL